MRVPVWFRLMVVGSGRCFPVWSGYVVVSAGMVGVVLMCSVVTDFGVRSRRSRGSGFGQIVLLGLVLVSGVRLGVVWSLMLSRVNSWCAL
jgi:hypothetical protein